MSSDSESNGHEEDRAQPMQSDQVVLMRDQNGQVKTYPVPVKAPKYFEALNIYLEQKVGAAVARHVPTLFARIEEEWSSFRQLHGKVRMPVTAEVQEERKRKRLANAISKPDLWAAVCHSNDVAPELRRAARAQRRLLAEIDNGGNNRAEQADISSSGTDEDTADAVQEDASIEGSVGASEERSGNDEEDDEESVSGESAPRSSDRTESDTGDENSDAEEQLGAERVNLQKSKVEGEEEEVSSCSSVECDADQESESEGTVTKKAKQLKRYEHTLVHTLKRNVEADRLTHMREQFLLSAADHEIGQDTQMCSLFLNALSIIEEQEARIQRANKIVKNISKRV